MLCFSCALFAVSGLCGGLKIMITGLFLVLQTKQVEKLVNLLRNERSKVCIFPF